jgi:CubicO group peptidase (beta-lactamase class C family)
MVPVVAPFYPMSQPGLTPVARRYRLAACTGWCAQGDRAMGMLNKVVLLVSLGAAGGAQAQLDPIFARWTADTPGCVVGVAQNGKPALINAYGSADLEHGVPNTPDTIFEAGSVSKQFTAAAVLLLAQDGKLSLDDPVRKYIPELPDYGQPLTIRHMLNHTSGLRDWGSVAALMGWPRGSRTFDHAQVLEIVARQRKLNFAPGTRWSYTNTGYNLAAIIVERVSGQSFPEFTRARIFAPLGMHDSGWRDDYARIVKRRAVAYEKTARVYRQNMPFENAFGNGAMLTTVADLLKWNANFSDPVVGGTQLVAALQQAGKFNDGTAHDYGLGLVADQYAGTAWIQHGGATAGYRAFLSRLPDKHLSVALLCNAADANTGAMVREIHAALLPGAPPAPVPPGVDVDLARIDARQGMYRDDAGRTLTFTPLGDGLEAGGRRYRALDAARMQNPGGDIATFGAPGKLTVSDRFGRLTVYRRVAPVVALPDARALRELVGSYYSADAGATWTVYAEGGKLQARHRAGLAVALTPSYRDGYTVPGGMVLFRRDGAGRVNGLSAVNDRVWDMPFKKLGATAASSR